MKFKKSFVHSCPTSGKFTSICRLMGTAFTEIRPGRESHPSAAVPLARKRLESAMHTLSIVLNKDFSQVVHAFASNQLHRVTNEAVSEHRAWELLQGFAFANQPA
jgi:hypothetical protein